MLVFPFVVITDRLLLLCNFDRNKQHIDTITATKNIKPSTQNANANFDVDIHKIPSECNRRTFGGYSSTKKKKTKLMISHFGFDSCHAACRYIIL